TCCSDSQWCGPNDIAATFFKTRLVSFSPQAIHHPAHWFVKRFPGAPLVGLEIRVLKLDNVALSGSHIGHVPFAIVCSMNDLLPIRRKSILPIAMPPGFVLPPVIAVT